GGPAGAAGGGRSVGARAAGTARAEAGAQGHVRSGAGAEPGPLRGRALMASLPATLGAFRGADAPDLEALRKCVHCGICVPQVPTFRVLGEEMDTPRGRLYLMRAAAEGRLGLTAALGRHPHLCLRLPPLPDAWPAGGAVRRR